MSKSKGDRRENQAIKLMEELGFTVENPNYSRYGNSDFFNLFDFMATCSDSFKLVQVKSNSTAGCLKEIKESAGMFPGFVDLEVWVCYDRKGWRIFRLVDNPESDWNLLLDGREKGNMGDVVLEKYS